MGYMGGIGLKYGRNMANMILICVKWSGWNDQYGKKWKIFLTLIRMGGDQSVTSRLLRLVILPKMKLGWSSFDVNSFYHHKNKWQS